MPATHERQLGEPMTLAYRPTMQLTHALEPATEYIPLWQIKHTVLDAAF